MPRLLERGLDEVERDRGVETCASEGVPADLNWREQWQAFAQAVGEAWPEAPARLRCSFYAALSLTVEATVFVAASRSHELQFASSFRCLNQGSYRMGVTAGCQVGHDPG